MGTGGKTDVEGRMCTEKAEDRGDRKREEIGPVSCLMTRYRGERAGNEATDK